MLDIDLQQPDPRCIYENIPPFRKMQIVLMLFRLDAGEKSVGVFDPQKVVWMKGADAHAIDIGGELKPVSSTQGKYAIVCMTSKEGEYADCYLSLYFECLPEEIILESKNWEVITEEEGDEDGEETPEKSQKQGLFPPIKANNFTDIVKTKVEQREAQKSSVRGALQATIASKPKPKPSQTAKPGYKMVNFTAFGKVYHKQIPIGGELPGSKVRKTGKIEMGASEEEREVPVVKDAMGLEVQFEAEICQLLGLPETEYREFKGLQVEEQEVVVGQYQQAKEKYSHILDLNYYGLEGRGLMAVIPAIEDFTGLQTLLLRKNNLTDTPVIYLFSALESARTRLEEVDLSENSALTDKTALSAYTYATRLHSLKRLGFEGVEISLAVQQKLQNAFKSNQRGS